MSDIKVSAIEVKHAVYCVENKKLNPESRTIDDCVVVKVNKHMSDGSIVPDMMHFKNFERDFFVTKKSKRNHKQKKSIESIDNLERFKCRQIDLKRSVARALGFHNGFTGKFKSLCRSPYIYGTDLSTPVIIKNRFKKLYPDAITENKIAVLDIETDVVNGTEEPILCSITSGNKAFIAYTHDYAKSHDDPEKAYMDAINLYVGDYVKTRNIEIEFYRGKNAGDICAAAIKKHHDWMVDFVVIWNISFDVGKIMPCLVKYDYNPADVFSHPSVEPKFRKAVWIPGKEEKEKYNSTSGKVVKMRIPVEQRWHVLDTPSNACWLCGMAVYYQLRKASGQESEYNLNYILNKNLKLTKLKFEATAHLEDSLHWHVVMQKNHRPEYVAYNLFDDISVELLFEKLGDFKSAVSVLIGSSEYYRFDSQTRLISDDLQMVYRDRGYICCGVSDEMEDELDKHVCSKDGWITTLASHLCHDNGVPFFDKDPLNSEIRLWVYDVDAKATYPSEGIACNIAQETTRVEFNKMAGLSSDEQRSVGINLTGGANNAAELLSVAYGMPSFDDVLSIFKQSEGII